MDTYLEKETSCTYGGSAAFTIVMKSNVEGGPKVSWQERILSFKKSNEDAGPVILVSFSKIIDGL